MATEPLPMDPREIAELRELLDCETAWEFFGQLPASDVVQYLEKLLKDRDYQAQRADEAESRADMFRVRAERYEAVLAELPGDCWPEYEGAPAVARLVARAEIGRQWEEDSSLERWFPFTAERLNDAKAEVTRLRGCFDRMHDKNVRLEAENTRLRSRVRVEAEDVERFGVKREHVAAWLALAARWRPVEPLVGVAPAWENTATGDCIIPRAGADHVAFTIGSIARCDGRCPWEILDEMARMEVAT